MPRGFASSFREREAECAGSGVLVVILALLVCTAKRTGRWSKQFRVTSGYPPSQGENASPDAHIPRLVVRQTG